MSETPGQALRRLWRASLLPYGAGIPEEWEDLAAAFLAEVGGDDGCAYCGETEVELTPTCSVCRGKAEEALA